ncbi:tyrosine-type recombinase/integrase [bacterium]|nr:tyrosine-type recombinase/integrase [bacterium]
MSFKNLQTEYVEKLRVAGYSERTLKQIIHCTNDLFEYLNTQNINAPSEITGTIIREYQAALKTRNISSVWLANKHTNCRRFLKFLYEENYTHEDHGLAISKVIKHKPKRKVLTQKETAALMMQPNVETSRGIRDRALLELLYSSGLRREEVIRIELYDLNIPEGLVKVTGKGNKQRIVPVGRFALYWIDKYIKEVRGVAKDQFLFVGLQTRRGLSLEYLGFLIKSCGRKSGIKKKITPHALRHACATHMMQNGAPSTMVQAFLGHEQLMTTQIYTHVLDEDLKKVMNNFHPRRWLNVRASVQLVAGRQWRTMSDYYQVIKK